MTSSKGSSDAIWIFIRCALKIVTLLLESVRWKTTENWSGKPFALKSTSVLLIHPYTPFPPLNERETAFDYWNYFFLMWDNPGLFCLFLIVKLFTTMIYKLGIQYRHFRIYDKLCSLSGLFSSHGREFWIGVIESSWLYTTKRRTRRQLKTRCSCRSFVGSSELFGLQCWSCQ